MNSKLYYPTPPTISINLPIHKKKSKRKSKQQQKNLISNPMDDIQENKILTTEYIILIDNRKEQRLIRPCDNRNFKWRKINIKLQQLANFQYYDNIEVTNDKLVKAEDQFGEEEELDEQEEEEQVFNSSNREIYTLEDAQKLQQEQINELKATKNANEIIETIVNNNEQFEKRTAYSKQKYLAKKRRKYLFQFHAQKPTLENIHKFYFLEDPKAVGYIRWDMFAFMLLQGSPYSNVLLAEKTKGILLGSLLQRSAKSITVCCEEVKNAKRFPIVEQLNIRKEEVDKIVQFEDWKGLAEKVKTGTSKLFTNLMMAGNYNFEEILEKLENALAPGCVICLHCQNLEPLQMGLAYMRSRPTFIHMKLQDMWGRVYQVLKNRTHPMMYMSSHSGYILTGIRVP